MSNVPTVLSWFSTGPLPGIIPEPAIVVAGTGALGHFFDGAELAACLPALERLQHARIELSIVTSSECEARRVRRETSAYAWRSVTISYRRGLHAKLYSFIGEGGEAVCLVGSHNLSWAGARTNEEAGVLFLARNDPQVREVALACEQHIQDLARGAVFQIPDESSLTAVAA
jgi:phosphatidylserine/phosphatidylglycerophosphate/cardiolipin synthase-like enzyme